MSTAGPSLQRPDLSSEAIRLARMVHGLLPGDAEVAGLLALMLLTDARREARTGPGGELVPMDEQDRGRWDRAEIAAGIELVDDALDRGVAGPYLLQAAIAAVHDRSPSADTTDWALIERLYDQLAQISDNPIVALNRVVAVAMAHGAAAGLELLATLEEDTRIAADHRFYAVRAHLLEMLGRVDADDKRTKQPRLAPTTWPNSVTCAPGRRGSRPMARERPRALRGPSSLAWGSRRPVWGEKWPGCALSSGSSEALLTRSSPSGRREACGRSRREPRGHTDHGQAGEGICGAALRS